MTATITEARAETEDRVITEPETSDSPEDCAHIVLVPRGAPDESPQAYVMRARIEGFPITALCGYIWVPNKMATGLPVCSPCKDEFENDPNGFNDRDRLPDE